MPATFELSGLAGGDGSTGFALNGVDSDDLPGFSVSSAGDVNGDGIDDFIIGAPQAEPGGATWAGETYVVFGSAGGFPASVDLPSLDGSDGFILTGIGANDESGYSVSSAGDVNGDGIDDIIIGAYFADPGGTVSGQSYVVFGSTDPFAASIDLGTLDGTNGFALNGIGGADNSGWSVSAAGDVNGDGIDDIIIGAPMANPNGTFDAGETYVVFGTSGGFAASIDLSTLDGTNGFVLNGIGADDESGYSVSAAGDVNGDGIDDIIIGAPYADPNGSDSGESYVVFGSTDPFAASIDLSSLDGSNGFVINGIDGSDRSGQSVSAAGDVNGDGIDDIIIGAPSGNAGAGESYVVFGSTDPFAASIDLSTLDGTNGFVLNGINGGDNAGYSVSAAGDVNGDGIDDIIIGAPFGDPNGDSSAGESYVLYGSSGGFAASIDLSSLDGSNGFIINGPNAAAGTGNAVSAAGDVNNDGFDDVIIGGNPSFGAGGQAFIVYGRDSTPVTFTSATTASYGENGTGVVIDIAANDGAGEDTDITYSITGGADSAAFTINSANGALSFAASPDFEAPGDVGTDNDYEVEVTATDGEGDATAQTITVSVTNVNDAPTVSGLVSDIALTEDTSGNIDLSGSAFTDVDTAGNVTVTLTASEGTFGPPADGSAVGAGVTETLVNATTITLVGTVADINSYLNTGSNITYTGSTNDNGDDTATVTVTANDGEGSGDVVLGTVNLDIAGTNDLPTGTTGTITISEDTSRALNGSDFGFSDVDSGDTLQSVRIDVQTITSGTLRLLGVDVTDGDVIAVADINAGNLVYTPAPDAFGSGLLSFTFSVNDGTGFAASTATLTVDVSNVTEPVVDPIRFSGTGADETVKGGSGDDTLLGGAGADIVQGGDGDDQIFAGANDDGEDTLDGGAGNDIIGGGAGGDFIEGGDGSDTLYGGAGNDKIYVTAATSDGDRSGNIVWAGTGDDTVVGDTGADLIGGGAGRDVVSGFRGSDVIYGGRGTDSLSGGAGLDTIFGGADSDTVDGGSGDDLLYGGAGDDVVLGGSGKDVIWAGAGDDVLTGGSGADTFVFGANSGNDTITDFDTAEDMLDLRFAAVGFSNLAEVTAAATTAAQDGQSGILIDLGGSQSVFLEGLNLDDLASINLVV